MRKWVKKVRGWWGWGAGGVSLIGLLLWFVFSPPSFLRVQEVVVLTPLKHLSEIDLVRLAEVRRGDNLLTLRLSRLRTKILRLPWIREVLLYKRVPGRLLIEVEEYRPQALLELPEPSHKGAPLLYLVDREGTVFKKAGPGDPKDLPILTGLSPTDLRERVKSLLSLLDLFEGSPGLNSVGVSELRWKDGKVSLFTQDPCVRIELGTSEWKGRLERLSKAWGTIRATSRKPKVVDLTFKKGIIVKQG